MNLTHINDNNNPTMVDVSQKDVTSRVAVASGDIQLSKKSFEALINNNVKKGPVIDTAIIAAIMGAKKTSDFIPMCHPLFLSKVDCNIKKDYKTYTITLEVSVKCEGKTGVEMEALSGVSIGLLTIYDMLKAIDKNMTISNIVLISKSGGKSGEYRRL
ncbi:cyclic pyranopterin monophosphate synthase MoaC [Helicobacter sp. 16-1353]|uniref:cyclic pyranopterin monophosphate synthase MoaC n=1 Tax=Helicobacter sp. 16-1353 TaxID=2004996 RepID=UPI000DCB950E|nr:cyclic pyranopterin monophosphate synthase MoaC [Helicobacter sp. 16-1353]RAX54743.1 cyclic pyranopterin monophosphate synthase MoaC [Helicobacter sp. 16-1353]